MKVKAYRLEKERLDGSFAGCQNFGSLIEAEKWGNQWRNDQIDKFNLIPWKTPKLFTVWEVTLYGKQSFQL